MSQRTTTSSYNPEINEKGMIDFDVLGTSVLNKCGIDGGRGDHFDWLELPHVEALRVLIHARGEESIVIAPSAEKGKATMWAHPAIAFAFALEGNPAFLLQISDMFPSGAKAS